MAKGKIILCVSNDLKLDQRIHRIAKSLSNAGYQVEAIGFGRENGNFPINGAKAIVQKTFFKRGKGFYLEIQIRLLIFLFFRAVDVICSCDADTIVPASWISKFRNKKLVFDAHEFFSETSGVQGRPAIKKFWKRIEKRYIPGVDRAYTVSQGLVEIMGKEFGIPFSLVRNLPVASENDKYSEDFEKGTFWIYQGAMNKGRGLENLLDAIKGSKKDLVLAGDGPLKKELEKKVSEYDLRRRVTFLGRVDPDKLKGITSLAFGGINLVDGDGLSYRHSLANKFFDYIAAGIPQINSDLPEYKKVCREFHCSEFVGNNSPQAIAAAFRNLETNEEEYTRMKQEAKRASYEFTWEKEEEKLLSIYAKLFPTA